MKRKDRILIINADGYGFTAGATDAIEECIEFGTVRSISVNINFPHAERLKVLIQRFPWLSVGCHLNPVVGSPVLPAKEVPTLVNDHGDFFYKDFDRRLNDGHICLNELRKELLAQVDHCRKLASERLTHIDCHMGKHRLPRFYPVFLDVVKRSGIKRIRTHWERMGMESPHRLLKAVHYYATSPRRIAIEGWDLWLRWQALQAGFAMPDYRLDICNMGKESNAIQLESWVQLVHNTPPGISEFVVHPCYVDNELVRWSTYLQQREQERAILLDRQFKEAIERNGVFLGGYADIPVC